jgi:hypothetical protein
MFRTKVLRRKIRQYIQIYYYYKVQITRVDVAWAEIKAHLRCAYPDLILIGD